MSAQNSQKKQPKVEPTRHKSTLQHKRCAKLDQDYIGNILNSHFFDYEREDRGANRTREVYERVEKEDAYAGIRR
jgi:hypothetical protein